MNWKVVIPWALAIVAGVYILVNAFKPSDKRDDTLFKMVLAEKDARIKDQQGFRILETQRADKALAESNYKDSLLQLKSKVNTIRYEKVPVIVNAMPNAELTSTIEDEFGR